MASVALMSTSAPDERPRVLIVDDEKFIRDILADFLGMEGYIVRTAEDGAAALSELHNAHYDLVISDLKMPRMGGIELLDAIGTAAPSALTVIMTGFGTVETAIDAMKRGAYDYILKPFKVEEVIRVVQRGLEKQRLAAENLRLREAVSLYKVSEAIAASLSLEEVLATIGDTAVFELSRRPGLHVARGRRGRLLRAAAHRPAAPVATRRYRRRAPRTRSPILSGDRRRPGGSTRGPRSASRASSGPSSASWRRARSSTTTRRTRRCSSRAPKGARFFATLPAIAPVSLVSVPLRMKTRLLGWISVASFTKQKRFNEGHRKLLSIVGSRAAAAIENARLYEDLRATFQQTIQGLARAIDKMDRYTAGHSERVAMYATYLAVRLGLAARRRRDRPPERADARHRQDRLRDEPEQAGQAHAGRVRDLQAAPGVRQGHPRSRSSSCTRSSPACTCTTSGGTAAAIRSASRANDVPLIARIIAVADTYDAMTSDRAYRRALPHEVAVGEIERCSGSQFDPEVAHSFTSGLEEFREELAAKGTKVPD